MNYALPLASSLKVGIGCPHLHLTSGIARERIIRFKKLVQNQGVNVLMLREKDIATVVFSSHGLDIESFKFGVYRHG